MSRSATPWVSAGLYIYGLYGEQIARFEKVEDAMFAVDAAGSHDSFYAALNLILKDRVTTLDEARDIARAALRKEPTPDD